MPWALRAWLEAAAMGQGPLVRAIDRHGNVKPGLTYGVTVARIVEQVAVAAGQDAERFSGHSLRLGFVTTAAMKGCSERSIANQAGTRQSGAANRTPCTPPQPLLAEPRMPEAELTCEAKSAIRSYVLKVLAPPAIAVTIGTFFVGKWSEQQAASDLLNAKLEGFRTAIGSIAGETTKVVASTSAEMTKQSVTTAKAIKDAGDSAQQEVERTKTAILMQADALQKRAEEVDRKIAELEAFKEKSALDARLLAALTSPESTFAKTITSAIASSTLRQGGSFWAEPQLLGELVYGKDNLFKGDDGQGMPADGLAYVNVGGDSWSEAILWVGSGPEKVGELGRRVHVEGYESAYIPVRKGETVCGAKRRDSGSADVYFIAFAPTGGNQP